MKEGYPNLLFKLIFVFGGVLIFILFALTLAFSQITTLKNEVGQIKTRIGRIEPPLPSPELTPTPGEAIEITGTIQYSDIEGGCWYIQPEIPECKGERCPLGLPANYEPLNLPKELQKTGLKAKFKLEVQAGVATTCQIGPVVKILEYQIIK